jgi:4'-phosphopantetheinyl transferase
MWENLPDKLILEKDTIQIYCVNLDSQLSQINLLENNLSEEEKIRANKFKFERLQNRFIVCRSILRILLGKYLNIKPSEIVFHYGKKGKPSLAKSCNHLGIEFNLSHSENFALYGFTLNRKIGVDLEYRREINELEKLVKRFFHSREYELLSKLENKQKQNLFFKIWTAKEAYLKALGTGISEGLDKIEIDNSQFKIDNNLLNNWQLYHLETNTNYVASVALENQTRLPITTHKIG